MQILSRKRLALLRRSGLLVVALIAMLWLAACTGAAPAAQPAAGGETPAAGATEAPAANASGGEVSRQDTLIFAADLSDLITLDPAVAYEFSGIQASGSAYETLVRFEPGKTGPQPLLAESWTISDTGDSWLLTFHLNPAAKFASGNPVTADDVAYSWGRAIDINKSPAFLFNDVAKLTKDEITAVDDHTLEVKLPKTVSPGVFLSVASFTIAAVVEKAQVQPNEGSDLGQTWLNDHSAGSAPYVLSSWQRNTNITLDANPNYWGAAPLIKRVIMQNVTENANLQAMIETGDADIVQDLGPEQAKALEGNPDLTLVKAESTLLVYVGMNATKPPLDNPDVREAIRYAINYDDINTLLAGSGKIVQEIIPDTFLGHTGKTYFTQDVAKAKELLQKAGVAEGTEIEFLVSPGLAPGGLEWNVIGSKIQSDLAAVGLTLNIKQVEQDALLTTYRAQGAEMVLINWGPDFPDPDGNVTPFTNYSAKSIAWRNAWDNKEISDMGVAAALELDPAKRVDLYAQLEDRVAHEGPYIMLYQPLRTYGVRNNISGFVYFPSETPSINFAIIGKK